MITGVQDVYYNVEDMERALAFYTEVLGCVRVSGDEYWTIGLRANVSSAGPDQPAAPALLADVSQPASQRL